MKTDKLRSKLRRLIVQEHGVEVVQPQPGAHREIRRRRTPPGRVPDSKKTTLIRYLELKHGESIELLLLNGSLRSVADKLGVSHGIIRVWRAQFNLNWSLTNLPSCDGCLLKDIVCQTTGTCHILTRSHADESLIVLKAKGVLS
jgi:hypothetical protein